MLLTPVFLVTLLTFFNSGNSPLTEILDHSCFSSFRTSPEEFGICRTQLCFIIVNVNPYVFLDDDLAATPSKPFFCPENNTLDSKLKGVFFNILRGVSEEVPEVSESR